MTITLDGSGLTAADVESVARGGAEVALADSAISAISAARAIVDAALGDGEPHYGINTGFGSLSGIRIENEELRQLQLNLIRSHSAGVGAPLPHDIVRGMMLLLAASLSRGCSGVRTEVVELIVGVLNAGVTPTIPSVGSVGASGDLAPLAHLALVLVGEGRATIGGQELDGGAALGKGGLSPTVLEAKEGLALINGTHLMAAEAALLVRDFERLMDAAVCACAMSIDGCKATDAFLDPRVHQARAHSGSVRVAEVLRGLLAGSAILPSHADNDPRVQDPYSLRCAPVVLGASLDCWRYVKLEAERELGATTDNPLVFDDGSIISAGNFHGMPIAIPMDALAIAISHVAGISERRTYLMLAARDPYAGLKAYLADDPGVQSGLMIAQYTAAACCNEIIGLCMPASVANLPTSAGTEDYNSFGPRSAAKARRAMELARNVVAIELICAAQALELHRPLESGDGVRDALAKLRAKVEPLHGDRSPAPDIEAVAAMIEAGELCGAYEWSK